MNETFKSLKIEWNNSEHTRILAPQNVHQFVQRLLTALELSETALKRIGPCEWCGHK